MQQKQQKKNQTTELFQQIKLIFRDNRFDCLLVKMDETFFS